MRNYFQYLSAFLLLVAAAGAHAQANDAWANRTAIATLPFTINEANFYQATVDPTDPDPPCRSLNGETATHTLWYSYTTGASTEYLTLRVPNNNVGDPIVSVYTGVPGAFRIVSGGCSKYSDDDGLMRIAGLRLAANTSYSIEVATQFGSLISSNTLDFSVTAATQYAVTKTADTNDGTCNADCSLREAIGASNANPGAVRIPAGTYTLTIAGAEEYGNATGSLDVLHGMGIYGAGMQQTVIDANNLDRALALDPVASLVTHTSFSIGDLSIIHGNSGVSATHYAGGGGLTLESNTDYFGLERVAITANHALRTGGGLTIFAPGTIRDCVVSNNTSAYFGGGGLYTAIDSSRYMEISGSTFSGNSETDQAGGAGGGIYAQATLLVSNSTISGNNTVGNGGGIFVEGNGSLHMANSTVVYNSAQTNPNRNDSGGGINMAGLDANPNTIIDSILAYNTVASPGDAHPDCALSGNSMTSSYNLVGSTNGSCTFVGTGDATGTDPKVSPVLGNNGGPTPTHALLSASAAIDAGNPAGCNDNFGALLVIDQRGVSRPQGARCDIGAFEFQDLIFRNGFEP